MSIKSLYKMHDFLVGRNIIKSLEKATIFYDEPQVCHIAAILNIPDSYRYKDQLGEVGASGISFDDPKEAIMKCMYEAIERYSLIFWKDKIKNVEFSTLHPAFIENRPNSQPKNSNIGTVPAINLKTGKETLIPAQSVYLTYYKPEEPFLSTLITTGAAGGFTLDSAINRAILEIIERDSFMTRYLLQKWPTKIDSTSINDQKVQLIFDYLKRYNLTPHLYESTNDIGIPTIFCMLIDETGVGPAISSGLSARYGIYDAMLNAILESLITRWWVRKELILNKIKANKTSNSKIIKTVRDRAFYWSSVEMLSQVKQFLSQRTKPINNKRHSKVIPSQLTDYILSLGYTIFVKDITNAVFKSLHYTIVRVVIPEMQPLYLNEAKPIIHGKRLENVAKFFDLKKYKLNKIPHPFL